jgi:hypothetical protein
MKTKLDPVWKNCARFCFGNRDHVGPYPARYFTENTWAGKLMRWGQAVSDTCGPDTTIEFVDGNCIVAGIMLFLYPEKKP